MSGVQYQITVDAFDGKNVAAALRFIADEVLANNPSPEWVNGDGGTSFAPLTAWKFSMRRDHTITEFSSEDSE